MPETTCCAAWKTSLSFHRKAFNINIIADIYRFLVMNISELPLVNTQR